MMKNERGQFVTPYSGRKHVKSTSPNVSVNSPWNPNGLCFACPCPRRLKKCKKSHLAPCFLGKNAETTLSEESGKLHRFYKNKFPHYFARDVLQKTARGETRKLPKLKFLKGKEGSFLNGCPAPFPRHCTGGEGGEEVEMGGGCEASR